MSEKAKGQDEVVAKHLREYLRTGMHRTLLLSLLYDLDLLPEQVKDGSMEEWQMLSVVDHFLVFQSRVAESSALKSVEAQ
jgi:hypothetical protein